MTSDALRDLLYNELRFGVRTLIFVANFFLLPRVCLALKDYRNLMPDTIGLIVFDNTEWTNFSSPTVHVVLMGIFILYLKHYVHFHFSSVITYDFIFLTLFITYKCVKL